MNNNNILSVSNRAQKYLIQDTTMETLEAEPIDTNRGLALVFLKILFQYGNLSTGFSYDLDGFTTVTGRLKYFVKRHRIRNILSRALYAILCLHMVIIVVNYDFTVSYSKLVNWIKRITYGVFVVKLMIMAICLGNGGRDGGTWIKILDQVDIIQEKFGRLGIYAPCRMKVKAVGVAICIVSFLLCIVHMTVFSIGKSKNFDWKKKCAESLVATFTLNQWHLDTNSSSNAILINSIGYCGFSLTILSWNLWYFCDALRVFGSLIVWIVFRKMNVALADGTLTMENFPDIIDLHLKGIKLLNLFNELLSPITFMSTVFNMMYCCFWTNFILISFEFNVSHIVGFITLARMIAVFYITADVNTQANQISSWLENSFSEINDMPMKVNLEKLILFSSLIYSRDVIGFKGYNFFTVTPGLNSAIVGFVLTYTVVVNQFVTN